jgi:hypothetical protein
MSPEREPRPADRPPPDRPRRPPRGRPGDVDFEDRLPPDVKTALARLDAEHGERISAALRRDPALSEAFFTNPVRAIESLGIQVPPALARFARRDPRVEEIRRRRGVRLPDGRVVAANVRVRFGPRRER